jgi:hypothetical protein
MTGYQLVYKDGAFSPNDDFSKSEIPRIFDVVLKEHIDCEYKYNDAMEISYNDIYMRNEHCCISILRKRSHWVPVVMQC